jgi:hypothetical protein
MKDGLRMTTRIFFRPKSEFPFYSQHNIDFHYLQGRDKQTSHTNILSMHNAITTIMPSANILDISTMSNSAFGNTLSAFNLKLHIDDKPSTVESTYQASKVFSNGGPFTDLVFTESSRSKKDERLVTSGSLLYFEYQNTSWPLVPNPNFYDYLYILALIESADLENLLAFNTFTDFAFNPSKSKSVPQSINCQARSAAIFVGMKSQFHTGEILSLIKELAIDPSRNRAIMEPTLFDF